jgi:hypothetical protein
MAISNAEKQARWRAKNVAQRRHAQRISSLLTCRVIDIDRLAELLAMLFDGAGNERLRAELEAHAPRPRRRRTGPRRLI